jgi:hypothetical protein
MTTLYRNVLSAQSRSNNLKEHLEGFKSKNGVGPIELPDPKTQMSGIISQLMEFKYITVKDISATAFQIRCIPEIKETIKHTHILTVIAKAIGYRNHNEVIAAAVGENKVVLNKKFGTCLITSNEAATVEQDEKLRRFWVLVSEVFIYVKANDFNIMKHVNGSRIDEQTEWYGVYVHPIMAAANIAVILPEESELNWTAFVFSMALAAKYPRVLTRRLWKKAFKSIPGGIGVTTGECRAISTDLMALPLKYLEDLNVR